LDEKPLSVGDFGPEAEALLLKQALAAGPPAYCDPEELDLFLNRVQFVSGRAKEFKTITPETVQETLASLCRGCRGLDDLKSAGLVSALKAKLPPQNQSLLDRLAPASVTLPTGRKLAIHYESGKAPWVQSRLQDFFGMSKGPAIAGGEVPVVLHLLSPRQEPVQITSDLAGFWQKHYPQVRKELMRRYPRHKWPERPEQA
jgi:ATP-dependent helicase HrpB